MVSAYIEKEFTKLFLNPPYFRPADLPKLLGSLHLTQYFNWEVEAKVNFERAVANTKKNIKELEYFVELLEREKFTINYRPRMLSAAKKALEGEKQILENLQGY